MENSIAETASAFSKAAQLPDAADILGDPGSAPLIEVPLDDRLAAELCFNPVLSSFILSVTFDTSRLRADASDAIAEALVLRTHRSRFGAGEMAGLDAAGRLSLSVDLRGASDPHEIAEIIQRSRRALSALVEDAAPPVQPEEMPSPGEIWLRV